MNLAQLLQHFDTLAETQDAVEKLRGFVRDLAVRGCLVPQSNKDESAKELLKRIADEKRSLASEGVGKDTPVLEPITTDDCPFLIPENWAWARTRDVTTYVQRGKSPKYSLEKKIPVIAQKCIQWHGFELHKAQFIEPGTLESYSEDRFVKDGDLLWNSTGLGTLGRIIVFKERYKAAYPRIVADSHVTVIRPSKFVDSDYLFCWFAGPIVQNEINAKASGSTKQTELATSTVLSYAIPLPPLAEQRRIVVKVEELLTLCDELEARQIAAREHRTNLVRSALDHLTTNQTEPEFRQHAAFVLQNSDLVLDSVSTLRQAISSLAVQGKLLPQNAKQDGTAEQGLNERHRRLKSNGATRKKSLLEFQAVDDASIPMPLPENWKWIRFGEVADRLEYGTSEKSFANENGVPTLRMGNVQDGKLDLGNLKYVPYECADLPKLFLDDGDIIFNRTNSAELVGKAAVFKGKPKSFTLASYLIRVSLDETIASPDFFNLAINSSYYRRTQIEPELTQQCGQANFSGSKLANSIVPLPPLAEQKRIVAKVDELMRWCDALEARLTTAQTTAAALLDATLYQILAA